MAAEALLTFDCLRVDYDAVCAVRDFSLQLFPGDVCGLVGPNGAGKTTTLRAAAGLIEPTYGHVCVAGFDLQRAPREAKRRIGFMPDYAPAYEDLTLWEFLDLYASAYELPRERRRARIDECIALAWLEEKRDELVGGLSRGMKQRLMLARTLLHDPPVLLLDEPASGLDPHGRLELRKLLLSLRAASKTILISSHILSEMSAFCNKMAVMERGRLVKFGSVEEMAGVLPSARKFFVRTAGDGARLADLLRAEPLVGGVERNEAGALFDWRGSDGEAAELLRRLVTANTPIVEFRPHAVDMEEIFLRSGVKKLS